MLQLAVATTAALRMAHPGACTVEDHGADAALARIIDHDCEVALPRVLEVWGRHWSRRVVVVVPSSLSDLERRVSGATDLEAVAAVVDSAQRVVVNPEAFATLSAAGRAVVLAHEITHVATGARPVPTWLSEGLADYIGFLRSGIPVTRAAAELAQQVRAGQLPARLPTDQAFRGPDLPVLYQQSWRAVSALAARIGRPAVIRAYRAVQAGASLESALRREGTGTEELTTLWLEDLRRQLG